jgi:hypothetical protein
VEGFIGPILMHLVTRELAESRLSFDVPVEDAARELAHLWVRAMTP